MILEMKDVCKEYSRGKIPVPVLKNINLQVDEGEYIAIMGPSGSGKTTLMNMVGCLDVPTSGTLCLNGVDVATQNEDQMAALRNRFIGFVFQQFHLLPEMDARDNVALPLLYAGVPLKERRERAEEALKMVGLEERMHFKPNQLSGGQCQRVAIARAVVGKPKLLLADEPTGALDFKTGKQILKLLEDVCRKEKMTVVIITHNSVLASMADKVIKINNGTISDIIINNNPKSIDELEW